MPGPTKDPECKAGPDTLRHSRQWVTLWRSPVRFAITDNCSSHRTIGNSCILCAGSRWVTAGATSLRKVNKRVRNFKSIQSLRTVPELTPARTGLHAKAVPMSKNYARHDIRVIHKILEDMGARALERQSVNNLRFHSALGSSIASQENCRWKIYQGEYRRGQDPAEDV